MPVGFHGVRHDFWYPGASLKLSRRRIGWAAKVSLKDGWQVDTHDWIDAFIETLDVKKVW